MGWLHLRTHVGFVLIRFYLTWVLRMRGGQGHLVDTTCMLATLGIPFGLVCTKVLTNSGTAHASWSWGHLVDTTWTLPNRGIKLG